MFYYQHQLLGASLDIPFQNMNTKAEKQSFLLIFCENKFLISSNLHLQNEASQTV